LVGVIERPDQVGQEKGQADRKNQRSKIQKTLIYEPCSGRLRIAWLVMVAPSFLMARFIVDYNEPNSITRAFRLA
jgi:hypothetical protein